MMRGVHETDGTSADRRRSDADVNEAARVEMMRMDAARSLGENLEQADALIKAAFELAEGLSSTQ
jgi:hypothetical protein